MQIGGGDLGEVAGEEVGVEFVAVGAGPEGEFEGVEVAPEAGEVAQGEGAEDVDLAEGDCEYIEFRDWMLREKVRREG